MGQKKRDQAETFFFRYGTHDGTENRWHHARALARAERAALQHGWEFDIVGVETPEARRVLAATLALARLADSAKNA